MPNDSNYSVKKSDVNFFTSVQVHRYNNLRILEAQIREL